MQVLRPKLGLRILISTTYFLLGLLSFGYGCFFITVKVSLLPLVIILSIGIGIAFIAAGINVLLSKIEYDDEKLITRSFKKQRIFYYKNITFFGRKIGSATAKSRVYYWIIKTKDGTSQIDIPVSFQSQEFYDFLDTLRTSNPDIVIKV